MAVRGQLVNSAVAFAVACLVMVTVHEVGHVLAALAQGSHPLLFGFSVDDRSVGERQQVVTAAAGPVLSLLSGLAVLAAPTGQLPMFWRLTMLWLGLLSVQEFSGYLITGPFAHAGDIGSILEVTHAPTIVGWLGFLAGWAITYLLGRHAVRRLLTFTSPSTSPVSSAAGVPSPAGDDATSAVPAGQLRALGLFAWLLGAAGVIVLSLGLLTAGGVGADIVLFEAFGVLTSGIFLIFVRLFLRSSAIPASMAGGSAAAPLVWHTPWTGIVVLVVIAALRQLALRDGLTF